MSITQILELNKKSGMLLMGVMFGLVILMVLPFAAAQPVLVTLVQSDTCQRSTSCVKLPDLISLDNSDQRISGKLYDDHRAKPQYRNHWEFYRYDKKDYIVCVDCDLGFQTHSKVITIESNPNFKYVLQKDNRIVNNTFYEYNGRHIQDCQSATVSSDLDLIKDTIQYMGRDCKVPSKYNEKDTIVKKPTKHTDCSYACQYQKFMKDAKEKSKKVFLAKPDIKLKSSNDKVKVN